MRPSIKSGPVFPTYVFDDVVDGRLEEFVHGFWREPQHPLRRPLHDVDTGKPEGHLLESNPTKLALVPGTSFYHTETAVKLCLNIYFRLKWKNPFDYIKISLKIKVKYQNFMFCCSRIPRSLERFAHLLAGSRFSPVQTAEH